MKRITKLSIVAAVLASTAIAAPLTLNTGGVDGNYHSVAGKSAVKEGKKQGLSVRLATSKGSEENIQRVNGTRQAGLVQRNVLTQYQEEHEGFDSVTDVATIGMECGFMVVPAIDNQPLTLADIQGEKIAIGKKGSGTAITFNQLSKNNADLQALKALSKGGERALGKVASGRYGAMFFVSIPDPKNPLIKEVASNPNLGFANMSQMNLGVYGEGKKPDLFPKRVPVQTNWSGKEVTQTASGICTSVDVVIDEDKMPDSMQDAIYKMSKNVRVQKATLFSMFNEAKAKAESLTK